MKPFFFLGPSALLRLFTFEVQGHASIQITSISPALCHMARASCIIIAVPAIFLQAYSLQALSGNLRAWVQVFLPRAFNRRDFLNAGCECQNWSGI